MTIFGDGASFNKTITHHGTALDLAFNYIFGSLLAGALPIAFFLNPLMFYYNFKIFKRKSSIVPALFLLLSVLDFLYSLRSINTIYNLMKPKQDPLFDLKPTLYQHLQSFFAYIESYSSMFVTMIMCVVRYVKIRAPFWAIANRRVLTGFVVVVIVVDFTWSTTVSAIGSLVKGNIWFSSLQGIMVTADDTINRKQLCERFYANMLAPFYIKVGLSLLFSILTVIELKSESGQKMPEIKRRSITMIVILNAGNVFWFVLCASSNIITESNHYSFGLDAGADWPYWYFYISFSSAVLAPALLAAYNPLVFCSRNTGLKNMIRHFLLTGRLEVLGENTTFTRSPVPSSSNMYQGSTSNAGNFNQKSDRGNSLNHVKGEHLNT